MGKFKGKITDSVKNVTSGVSDFFSDNQRNILIVIVGAVILFGMLIYNALTTNETEELNNDDVYIEDVENDDSETTTVEMKTSDYEKLCKSAWVCDKGDIKYYMVFEPEDFDLGLQSVHIYDEYPDKPLKDGRYADDAYYNITLSGGVMIGTSYDFGDMSKEYYFKDDTLFVDGDEYKPYDLKKLIHISFNYGTGADQVYLDHGTSEEENQ